MMASTTARLAGGGVLALIGMVSAVLWGGCATPGPASERAAAPIGGAPPTVSQGIARYTPVTDQRLEKPEPDNWLMYRGNYDGWGYSPLDKITAGNAQEAEAGLDLLDRRRRGPPVAADRQRRRHVRHDAAAQVLALDAKTGDFLWRYKRELPEDLSSPPDQSRRRLYGDKVYLATVDCFLVALDAKTGKVLWDQRSRTTSAATT